VTWKKTGVIWGRRYVSGDLGQNLKIGRKNILSGASRAKEKGRARCMESQKNEKEREVRAGEGVKANLK